MQYLENELLEWALCSAYQQSESVLVRNFTHIMFRMLDTVQC